jgi:hypothetical protein
MARHADPFGLRRRGAASFLGAGVLLRGQMPAHRFLLAALGVGELALISLTEDRPRIHATSNST